MAKRRYKEEQELPFVALMDTMTNVVGVLTIVMVMIGISLARAASRVFSDLPPATDAQIQAAQSELDRLRAERISLQDQLAKLARQPTPKEQAAIDAELAKLERTSKDKRITLIDTDPLTRELAEREKDLQRKKAEADRLQAERDRLKTLLENTPVPKETPARIVRIPVSRPIPKDARIEEIFVTKNGAYWVDKDSIKKAFLGEFSYSSIRQTVYSQVKRDKKMVTIYDYQKLVKYFEKRNLMVNGFKVEVFFQPSWWGSTPALKLRPTGTPLSDLKGTLWRIKHMPQAVVMFHVAGDGFENYLTARDLADNGGIPAGWDYAAPPQFLMVMWEIETNGPKPPPQPKKPAVGGKTIKPPTLKLD